MKAFSRLLFLLLAFAAAASLHAQTDAEAIRAMMDKSASDWNRGDLDTFATAYKQAPDILFIGPRTSRGYDGMLARYRSTYSTRAKMGTLSFSDIEIQPLDERFATLTGRFHLERTAAGGGSADGFYLLVVEKTSFGWKIIRDDSTVLPGPAHP